MAGAVYLTTAYLAPVEYYSRLQHHPEVVIEQYDHYIKQTYRNRCVIASANGPQILSIPVEKPDTAKCLARDIRMAEHGNWRHIHWNALVSAYHATPFFEYYADDFLPFYKNRYEFLFDFNEQLRAVICRLMNLEVSIVYSSEYQKELPVGVVDCRENIHPKRPSSFSVFKPYYQVFEQKYGFTENLSCIDLLFNMGPESVMFL